MLKIKEINDNENFSLVSNGNIESNNCSHSEKVFEPSGDYEVSTLLERDTEALGHQIAGHSRTGVLKHKLGYVLKPLQKEPLGTREVNFYFKVFGTVPRIEDNDNYATTTPDQDGDQRKRNSNLTLQKYLSKFYGVMRIHSMDEETGNPTWKHYIALEDLVEGFLKPCVVDIKVGAQTWDSLASPKKVAHERSKYIGTKQPIGLSLSGMQYYDLRAKKTSKMEKEFGKTLVVSTFIDTIYEFLNGASDPTIPNYIATKLLPRLKEIQEYFKVQREFCFYSSSLLIGYDAYRFEAQKLLKQNCNWELNDNLGDNTTSSWLRVCMIDFAHVTPMEGTNPGPDTNYQFGLNNLIKIFSELSSSTDIQSSSDSE